MKILHPFLLFAIFPFQLVATATVNIDAEHYDNTYKSTHYDIEQRGCDYVDAFYRLRSAHPHSSIYAVVKGVSIDHITDMVAMSQKSMLMITYGKNSRLQTKVVPVEEMEELGLRGVSHSPIRVYFPQSTDHKPHDHHHIHDVDDIPNHTQNPNVHYHQVPHTHSLEPECEYCPNE